VILNPDANNQLVISGNGFDTETNNNVVKTGNVTCSIVSCNANQIICQPGNFRLFLAFFQIEYLKRNIIIKRTRTCRNLFHKCQRFEQRFRQNTILGKNIQIRFGCHIN